MTKARETADIVDDTSTEALQERGLVPLASANFATDGTLNTKLNVDSVVNTDTGEYTVYLSSSITTVGHDIAIATTGSGNTTVSASVANSGNQVILKTKRVDTGVPANAIIQLVVFRGIV